ncbi:hypothetical protein B0H21DRAFT_834812 [Amylocystis lapponica]|nr:hypothetical protein B0H21DRAFT_834812 [Amylocystis lapponica]
MSVQASCERAHRQHVQWLEPARPGDLLCGVKQVSLAMDQAKGHPASLQLQPAQHLQRLLAVEDKRKRDYVHTATSRHSRFGTPLSVQFNPKKVRSAGPPEAYVLHREQALSQDAGAILDMAKHHRLQKDQRPDRALRWTRASCAAVRTFVEACFNHSAAGVAAQEHQGLYITTWFLEFFLCVRAWHGWAFGLVAEVMERAWISWVLRRMHEALTRSRKLWTEFQAGVNMYRAGGEGEGVADVAAVLQQQIIHNGEVLDLELESVHVYREGTQSLAYLNASVRLAHALFRMLERWGKARGAGGEMYIHRKAKAQ